MKDESDNLTHLHTPARPDPVCGAPIPADRRRGLTAYRSEITCPACLATLRPIKCWKPCDNDAVVWVEWPTTGRPKGTYLCSEHYDPDATDNSGRPRYTVVQPVR